MTSLALERTVVDMGTKTQPVDDLAEHGAAAVSRTRALLAAEARGQIKNATDFLFSVDFSRGRSYRLDMSKQRRTDPDDEVTVVIPVMTLAEVNAEWRAQIEARNTNNATETAAS